MAVTQTSAEGRFALGFVKNRVRALGFGLIALLAAAVPAMAQDSAPSPDGKTELPWSSRCTSPVRDVPATCQIEQRAVVTETGQLLLLVTVVVPGESRQPVMSVRTPLQLFLPAGVRVDIDGRNAVKLDYQTCDQQGCYARMDISNAVLDAMFKGLKLNMTIEDLAHRQLAVPMSLTGFSAVYERIR